MSVAEREFFRKRVQLFLGKNSEWRQSEVVKHFVLQGHARSSVYKVLDKLATPQPIKEKKRTGRPSSWTPANNQKLKRLTNNRTGISQRKLGRKFGVSHMTIGNQLSKMKIKYRKREKTPKYGLKQLEKAKKLSRYLLNHLRDANCSVVMDDEKYFTFSGDHMPGNSGYYSNNKDTCPERVRFAGKLKYPNKVLVWVAISERGMSKVLIKPQKSASINTEVYIAECLDERLLPFLHKYHSDFNYIFWPDLAPAHYSNDTVAWMSENLNFVPKDINPPNVPQARPIENFWGILAQKVYEGGWEATTKLQLTRRIEAKIKQFDAKFFQTLMAGINGKLRKIAEGGPLSSFKS